MRFSLKTLVVLILFCALGVNLVAKWHRSRVLWVDATRIWQETERLRAMTDAALRTSEDQRQAASHWKMRLTERTEAERTIRAIFDGLIEQESVIEPNGNQVAVREVPMIESLLDYRKSWKIHVPASRSMSLRLDFADKQDNRIADSIDFANQQAVVVPLATGLNHVTFQFGINEHGEPTETFLEINGREVARLEEFA